jgi:hypothetical protein
MVGRRFYVPTGDEARDKAWRLSMEERMNTLETQQRLFNASVKGGAIQVLRDEDARLALNMGVGSYQQPDGTIRTAETFSFVDASIASTTTFHMLLDEEHGWIVPRPQFNFVQDTFIPITSATYVNVWKSMISVTAKALVLVFLTTADASTVGKVRLNLNGIFSDEITINATEQKVCRFTWDLRNKFDFGDDLTLRIQALRVSGAGNVNVYSPDVCHMAAVNLRSDATTGGIAIGG